MKKGYLEKDVRFLHEYNPIKDYMSDTIGILKYVPAGSFQRDNAPENISSISAFRMSATNITREVFVALTGLPDPSYEPGSLGSNAPVNCVNWYSTLVFCNRLSLFEQLTPVYIINESTNPDDWGEVPEDERTLWNTVIADWNANGYRLPTLNEWYWAAMGADTDNPGEVNSTGHTKLFSGFNGSNNIEDYAWMAPYNNQSIQPVGTKLPNELGLFDMSGNGFEWCWDWSTTTPGTLKGFVKDYRGDGREMHEGTVKNSDNYSAHTICSAYLNGFPDFTITWSVGIIATCNRFGICFRVVRK